MRRIGSDLGEDICTAAISRVSYHYPLYSIYFEYEKFRWIQQRSSQHHAAVKIRPPYMISASSARLVALLVSPSDKLARWRLLASL